MKVPVSKRIIAIDILRGLVIVLMALDHTRDFWSLTAFDPTDVSQTTPAWYFTRWITHLCAPLFVFLTGVGALLYGQKVQSKSKLRNYLFTRGLWLIILELTVVNLSWQFDYNHVFVAVIWILGWSMIILSGLIYLPKKWILITSLPFLLLHNFIDDDFMNKLMGDYSWIWSFLHQPSIFNLFGSNFKIDVFYPIIPWFSLMALGYVFGNLYLKSTALFRQKTLLWCGFCFILGFVFLRLGNFYGDPNNWEVGSDKVFSFLSFLNVTKYPPSLQYLLITVGIGLILLALFDKISIENKILYPSVHWLKVIGGVPMFFYIIHVPIINLSTRIYTYFSYGKIIDFYGDTAEWPAEYTPNLALTYLVWVVLIIVLYIPCKRYGELKRRSKNKILSYL